MKYFLVFLITLMCACNREPSLLEKFQNHVDQCNICNSIIDNQDFKLCPVGEKLAEDMSCTPETCKGIINASKQ